MVVTGGIKSPNRKYLVAHHTVHFTPTVQAPDQLRHELLNCDDVPEFPFIRAVLHVKLSVSLKSQGLALLCSGRFIEACRSCSW